MYQDLPERNPNVIFSQNPGTGPCRAIPLEQLTKVEREIKRRKDFITNLQLTLHRLASTTDAAFGQLYAGGSKIQKYKSQPNKDVARKKSLNPS